MTEDSLIENIRSYGTCRDDGKGKARALEEIGFRTGQPAEYAIIMGCFQPEAMPHVLRDLKALLDLLGVSYTLLPREYCCGWLAFGQQAVMAKDEEAIARYGNVSREFVLANFEQARTLGAKAIALFCAACEPSYTNCADAAAGLEVVSYSEMLERHWRGGRLQQSIDYYAGCYRFRRRITSEPVDIEPAARLLRMVEGLHVRQVDSTRCCFIPPHMQQLSEGLANETVVTICTGCYHNLCRNLEGSGKHRVKMLPELLLEAARGA